MRNTPAKSIGLRSCDDRICRFRGFLPRLALLGTMLAAAHGLAQQQDSPLDAEPQMKQPDLLPDSPSVQSVSPSPANWLPPLTPRQKFALATSDAFSFSSAFFTAASAGLNHVEQTYPEFHQGAEGYGRYYWHAYADQAVDSYVKDFLLPTILHEDPRYYRLGAGGFLKRTGSAFGHVLITRSDSGQTRFNTSQMLGSGISVSIETLYYPGRERTGDVVARNWALDLLGAGLLNGYKEFSPEVHSALKSLVPHIGRRDRHPED